MWFFGTFFDKNRIHIRMKTKLRVILFIFSTAQCIAQDQLVGVWQGLIIKDGSTADAGQIMYAEFTVSDGSVTGRSRNELYDTDQYAVKNLKGSVKSGKINITELVVVKKKSTGKTSWCNLTYELKLNDSSGYLSGRYSSTDCKRNTGQIILFRSNFPFDGGEQQSQSHLWVKNFVYTLKKGYSAPAIREKERKEFQFEPVYFDYDKAELKPEFIPFLTKMARVVDGHTDLRIKVTGHTDGDGSDAYNLELSKRRAETLVNFFVSQGLSHDRIVIDFKGEKEPVDNNATPEGKQRNRRVDFSFI
jgi:outer membrane protein OmpA-like peptidoglycan-associated protein